MAEKTENVTDANFDMFMAAAPAPVLVHFRSYGDWCTPCHRVALLLKAMAKEFGDKVVLTDYDVDASDRIRQRHKVTGVPTLLIFKDSRAVERIVGPVTKIRLRALIQKHIGA